ncbi:hypothetical protein HDE_02006 [Halotydeus destructor]|nr:hypothetical protein HDE_02006 [Halotydeus destructor]
MINLGAIVVLVAVLSPVPGEDEVREKLHCRSYGAPRQTTLVYECDLCEVDFKGKPVNHSLLDAAEDRCEAYCNKEHGKYAMHMYTACDQWRVNNRGTDVCKCSARSVLQRNHNRFYD